MPVINVGTKEENSVFWTFNPPKYHSTGNTNPFSVIGPSGLLL